MQNIKAEYYLLDDDNDLELVREEIFMGDSFAGILNLPLFSSYLIKLKNYRERGCREHPLFFVKIRIGVNQIESKL